MLFKIYAGLGGSFGGAEYIETIEAIDIDNATEYAYHMAIEEYQSYEGNYGIMDMEDIRQEFEDEGIDYDESDVEERYTDELEMWIDYFAVEVTEED